MTIEQKAKAYDKAIERAKLSRQQLLDIGEEATEIEYIFPELTESEDVKEKLIKFFQRYPYKYIADAEMFTKDAIAWLEKQGEHNKWKPSKDEMDALYGLAYITNKMDDKKDEAITKLYQDLKREFFNGASYENMFPSNPVDSDINIEKQGEKPTSDTRYEVKGDSVSVVNGKPFDYEHATITQKDFASKDEPKFKVGDWIVRQSSKGKTIAQILDIQEQYYIGLDINGNDFTSSRFLSDDKIYLWSIQDAKDGDVLQLGKVTAIFKKFINYAKCECYCSIYNGEFEIRIDNIYGCYNATPATKEQRDALMKAMTNAEYIFDFEKKELKKIEQKPADKVEPRFKNGQWIVWRDKCYKVNCNGCGYELIDQDGLSTSLEYGTIDENAHLWTLQDANDGDVLVYNNGTVEIILLFKKWMDGVGKGAYSYAHTFDNKILFNDWSDCGYGTHPATKEQCEQLFKAMHEAEYEWDNEKKELKEIEKQSKSVFNASDWYVSKVDGKIHDMTYNPNNKVEHPKWTEEDEVFLKETIECVDFVYKNYSTHKELYKNLSNNTIDILEWIKSLKQRIKK